MPQNFYIEVGERGLDDAIKRSKEPFFPLFGELRIRERYRSPREKDRMKRKKARKRARAEQTDNELGPLSMAIIRQKGGRPAHVPIILSSVPLQSDSASKPKAVEVVREDTSNSALIIPVFLSDPPVYGVIKDMEKFLLGFPFGGQDHDEGDRTIFDAARRELGEELFCGLDVKIPEFSSENLIGTMEFNGAHKVFVFVVEFVADTPIKEGEEQEAAVKVAADKIDEWIKQGIFLEKHAIAWEMFKKKTAARR